MNPQQKMILEGELFGEHQGKHRPDLVTEVRLQDA